MLGSRLVPMVLFACLLAVGPRGARSEPPPGPSSERWYEILRQGEKLGHSQVVWAPSTWQARPTVHDTTTITERSVRNMLGIRDVFEVVTIIDLERGADGTLWWMRTVVQEAGRDTIEEVTWKDDRYLHVTRLADEERRVEIPLEGPVVVDSESFLGAKIRAGEIEIGDRLTMRVLDVRARAERVLELHVEAREEVPDASRADGATTPCFRVRETDPESGAATVLWIDDEGAFVRLTTDGGSEYRRVSRGAAESKPARAAESRITTPSEPVLERVMSADRMLLDLRLQGDASRAQPRFPDSPWSRTVAVDGDDEQGWVYHLELRRYDDATADTTLPLESTEAFARDLEPSVLMPCGHETVREVARTVVGEERSARAAAARLARWVFESLEKSSPQVGQASALEILADMSGDCSEHALLFVTLCRAAGIPARRCSGYVCVGSDWGAHAWAEIWVGSWISADPTTGEIGGAARYLFFGYPDLPDSHPGVVSARASGRMRFVTTRIEEGAEGYDLGDPTTWIRQDREEGRYVHVLAGLEARDVPRDWIVRMHGVAQAAVRGPGLRAQLTVSADQGMTLAAFGGPNATFAGAEAKRMRTPGGTVYYIVHARRRLIQVEVQAEGEDRDEKVALLEQVFAASFAPLERAPEPALTEK